MTCNESRIRMRSVEVIVGEDSGELKHLDQMLPRCRGAVVLLQGVGLAAEAGCARRFCDPATWT